VYTPMKSIKFTKNQLIITLVKEIHKIPVKDTKEMVICGME
jgi:hypothetical protein